MILTDYEKGLKDPADLIAKVAPGGRADKDTQGRPIPRRCVTMADDEVERRHRLLCKALARAGSRDELASAVGVSDTTLRRWLHKESPTPDKAMAALEALLDEGAERRGHGVEWCPVGVHYVPESKMHVNEGGVWTRLSTCRDCQHRASQAPITRDVQAEMEVRK